MDTKLQAESELPPRYGFLLYFVDTDDERGQFSASVRTSGGSTIFKLSDDQLIRKGHMVDKQDLVGLQRYLSRIGVIRASERLVVGSTTPFMVL